MCTSNSGYKTIVVQPLANGRYVQRKDADPANVIVAANRMVSLGLEKKERKKKKRLIG